MNSPSNELKNMANQPTLSIEEMDAICIEWAELLWDLPIVATLWSTRKSVADAVQIIHDTEPEEGELMWGNLFTSIRDYLDRNMDGDITFRFMENNKAELYGGPLFELDKVEFEGTWEDVTRKILLIQKEFLARIPVAPVIPDDLKS